MVIAAFIIHTSFLQKNSLYPNLIQDNQQSIKQAYRSHRSLPEFDIIKPLHSNKTKINEEYHSNHTGKYMYHLKIGHRLVTHLKSSLYGNLINLILYASNFYFIQKNIKLFIVFIEYFALHLHRICWR